MSGGWGQAGGAYGLEQERHWGKMKLGFKIWETVVMGVWVVTMAMVILVYLEAGK